MRCCGRGDSRAAGANGLEQRVLHVDADAAKYRRLPIVAAVAAAVVMKVPILSQAVDKRHLIIGTVAAASILVLAAWSAKKIFTKRLSYIAKHISASVKDRKDLLERIRSELPMKEALVLLKRFDPEGDHKMLIEEPKAVLEERERAQERLQAVLRATNDLINVLANQSVPPEQTKAVRDALDQLAEYRELVPAMSRLDFETREGLDTFLMSKLVATPATKANNFRTPKTNQSQPAAKTAVKTGRKLEMVESPIEEVDVEHEDATAESQVPESKQSEEH